MSPLVSIIIPVFNRQKVFERSLESALNQTYKNCEIIVVDDGSEPGISLSDSRKQITDNRIPIRLYRQENKGAPAARNFGFSKSIGDYVIFWDADVIAAPKMLEKMMEALVHNPDVSYAYCDFYFGKKKMRAGEFDADRLRSMNYITTTSLIRREDFPGFDENLKKFQDWDLWLTMFKKNKTGVYIPEYLFSVETGGTMSRWLPSFCYQAPWKYVPGIWGKVKKYGEAREIIKLKHDLE